MEMAQKQHSAETSSAQTSRRPNGRTQTVAPKCHVPSTTYRIVTTLCLKKKHVTTFFAITWTTNVRL